MLNWLFKKKRSKKRGTVSDEDFQNYVMTDPEPTKAQKVYEPDSLIVTGGHLNIVFAGDKNAPARIGMGTKIYHDEKDIGGVARLVLTIAPDEAVRAEVTYYV